MQTAKPPQKRRPGRSRGPAGTRAKGRRSRLEPSQRRAQLLAASLRVFARYGLSRATHAQVAAQCGVSVATAFVYFPTRAALVAAVLDEVERTALAIAERCYGGRASAPQAIRRHIRETLDSVDAEPAYGLIWLDWSTAVRDPVWPRYLEFQARIVGRIAQAIARGQQLGTVRGSTDPQTCARLIVGSTQMLAQMHFTQEPRSHIEAFGDAVVDMALGLAPA